MNVYGLIGYPLGHSFSKQYFTEKFEKEGIRDCMFESFPIPVIEEFPALLKSCPALKGLSVTIPYKEQVLQYVDEWSDDVKVIGATNSIKVDNGKLTAYNTDVAGFEISFSKLLQPHHKKALVLGTGGASKAVQFVLNKLSIEFLVVTRNKEGKRHFITYNQMNEALLKDFNVIINCTPVGMYPNEYTAPDVPYHLISDSYYLYDLVYKPAETLFLKNGKERGAVVQNGYEMLLLQAEESWRIWNS